MQDIHELKAFFEELAGYQKKQLLKEGRRIIPHVTPDDLLQPNDFPELENSPHFRYEEGILGGIQMAEAALLAWLKDRERNVNPS